VQLSAPKPPIFNKFPESLKKIGFYPALLFLIILIICIKNYTPGTFLTGWDTLHPEFNLSLYWQRILGGVWQEHQGLGAVASQSHASEIPRMVLYSLIDLFFGLRFVRYAYAFLTLFLGSFGVYFFLKDVLLRRFEKASKLLGAFVGALFYLLNLGTLQHFYVPLEMFLTHFGFLGWYMWSSSLFYQTGKRKYLVLFFLFTLFGSSQAHTSTLFYAFFIYFFAYFLLILLTDLSQKLSWRPEYLKRTAIIFGATLIINFFWLLPNFYFAVGHGGEVNMSKIHGLFSNEAFLANKKYGGTQDVTILRSFLFSWGEHTGNAQYGELLDEWILHLNSPGVLILGYGLFIFACIGVIASVVRREKFGYGVFAFFAIGIFFLFNVNPPFGGLFVLMQNTVPLFKEAFRFPFTKFSIGLMFAYSAFFGYALSWYANLFHKITQRILLPKFVRGSILVLVTSLLIYYMWPAFSGNLLSSSMRVDIPKRYFEMFKYFDSQEGYGRIADFPVHSFWGWVYYDWIPANRGGYQGAGFLWFGIKQPLLNREFDRWNLLNEQYYREMSYAVYSRDPDLMTDVLDKYKIRWLLVDESVMIPAADSKQLFYPEIKKLFAETQKISLSRDFGQGLYVYEYSSPQVMSRVESHDTFYPVGDVVYKEPYDTVYSFYNPYISGGEENFPYVGVTNTDETVKEEYVQNQGDVTFVNPKFITGDAILTGKDESGEKSARVPLTAALERLPGNAGLVFSINHVSSGEELMRTTFDGIDSGSAVAMSVNGDPRGLFINSAEFGKKEVNFYYNVGAPNSLNIFTLKEGNISIMGYTGELEPCSDLYGMSSYEIKRLEDGFTLTGSGLKACLTLPVTSVLDSSEEVNVSNPYVIKADVTPDNPYSICVFSNKSGLCENYYRDGVHMFTVKGNVGDYFLRFNSNALGSNSPVATTFRNIKIYSVENTIASQIVLDELKVLTPFVSEPYKIANNMSFGGKATEMDHYNRYCNLLQNQDEMPNISGTPGVLTYSSAENAVCDSFPFPYLPQTTGYLLEVRAHNVAGAPLRMCLTNEFSKRCDLYVELPKNPEMESYYYLIPPMGDEMGYTVNFSNLIFGSDYTENQLESVRLSPIPYNYLRSFHTEVLPENGKQLIVLNEAYEKGWTAFCGLVPCKAEHVTVNNWANGWVFEGKRDASGIKFIFLPELLEYLGLLILIPVAIFTFRYKEKFTEDKGDRDE